MNSKHERPSSAVNSTQESPTDAARLRRLISAAGLSQRAAARELGIDERTMRYWCAGEHSPPAMAYRALDPRVLHYENLKRLIRENRRVIDLIEAGKMTVGRGPVIGDSSASMEEAHRLRRKNEEFEVMIRVEDAFQRRQSAFLAVHSQWSPHGTGIPSEQSIAEFEAAETEWRAAVQEEDRIVQEIRSGKRR
jgi:transcriptional regulator with XRE-family HTH domain